MNNSGNKEIHSSFSQSDESQSPVPSRLSFREAFSRAAIQTELKYCGLAEIASYRDLCYIMAEVYILRPDSRIKVGGEILDAYLVQEIFGELRHEHLEMVLDNFSQIGYEVKNKRAYLRTALYNSVFEIEAHYTNEVNTANSWG